MMKQESLQLTSTLTPQQLNKKRGAVPEGQEKD